jgi:hypothetical protein
LKAVLDDRIVVLDSAMPLDDIEIPLNILDQYWEGYAIALHSSTWKNFLLWGVTVLLCLVAVQQLTKMLQVFIGGEHPRRSHVASSVHLLILYALASLVTCGCGTTNPEPARLSDRLKFERETVTVTVPMGASLARYSVPFSVQGSTPVTIESIEKSCQCAAVGEELVGKELNPGVNYSLPIDVDVTGRNAFKINLIVRTTSGDIAGVTLQGVVSTPPRLSPSVIVCEHASHATKPVGGIFTVNYVRRATDIRLAPVDKVIHGQDITLTLQNSKEVSAQDNGNAAASAVLDVLEWRWELTSDTPVYAREKIALAWDPELEIPPSTVEFEKVAIPVVKGFVGRVYCGHMAPGETWNYTMNLVPDEDGLGLVESVACNSGSVTTAIDNASRPITPLHIRVQAPTTAGEFDTIVNVKFVGLPESLPVKVYGRVEGKAVLD